MANTNVQRQVHKWIRNKWLPQQYGVRSFQTRPVSLRSGGTEDAWVSDDGQIVMVISTSVHLTATNKLGSGKRDHIFAELYFLLLMDIKKKVIVLTDQSMYEAWLREKDDGRVPSEVQFVLAELPVDLAQRLDQSRRQASREVSPAGGR